MSDLPVVSFDEAMAALGELLEDVSFDDESSIDVPPDPSDPDDEPMETKHERKGLTDAQRAEVDAETEKIKANREGPGAVAHRFQAADWTHPNGHPRCLLCGDEEPADGWCPGG